MFQKGYPFFFCNKPFFSSSPLEVRTKKKSTEQQNMKRFVLFFLFIVFIGVLCAIVWFKGSLSVESFDNNNNPLVGPMYYTMNGEKVPSYWHKWTSSGKKDGQSNGVQLAPEGQEENSSYWGFGSTLDWILQSGDAQNGEVQIQPKGGKVRIGGPMNVGGELTTRSLNVDSGTVHLNADSTVCVDDLCTPMADLHQRQYVAIPGVNYPHNDIQHFDLPSANVRQQCTAKCNRTNGCVGFVIEENGPGQSRCWLKNGMPPENRGEVGDRTKRCSYINPHIQKQDVNMDFVPLPGQDFIGNDIQGPIEMPASTSRHQCTAACRGKNGCVGFILENRPANASRCWLKHSMPASSHRVRDKQTLTGYMNAADYASFTNLQTMTDAEAACYLERYPDLKGAFNTDIAKAKMHWREYGTHEGRNKTCDGLQGMTDAEAECYLLRNPDLKQAFGSDLARAKEHWAINGLKEGRSKACPAETFTNYRRTEKNSEVKYVSTQSRRNK